MPNPPYAIALDEADLAVLGAALNELPYKVAKPVVDRIQAQINEWDRRRAEEAKAGANDE